MVPTYDNKTPPKLYVHRFDQVKININRNVRYMHMVNKMKMILNQTVVLVVDICIKTNKQRTLHC